MASYWNLNVLFLLYLASTTTSKPSIDDKGSTVSDVTANTLLMNADEEECQPLDMSALSIDTTNTLPSNIEEVHPSGIDEYIFYISITILTVHVAQKKRHIYSHIRKRKC